MFESECAGKPALVMNVNTLLSIFFKTVVCYLIDLHVLVRIIYVPLLLLFKKRRHNMSVNLLSNFDELTCFYIMLQLTT